MDRPEFCLISRAGSLLCTLQASDATQGVVNLSPDNFQRRDSWLVVDAGLEVEKRKPRMI